MKIHQSRIKSAHGSRYPANAERDPVEIDRMPGKRCFVNLQTSVTDTFSRIGQPIRRSGVKRRTEPKISAFLFPSINSLLIDSSTPEFRGKAYGYFYAFFSIGTVAGTSVIGYLDLEFSGSFMLTGFILLAIAGFTLFGNTKKNSFDNAPPIS